jgi:hypothetical protein
MGEFHDVSARFGRMFGDNCNLFPEAEITP